MTDQATTTTEGVPASQGAGVAATDAVDMADGLQAGESAAGGLGTEVEADSAAVPEAGEPGAFALLVPEGQVLDSQVLSQFEGVARELNLTQASAQRVLDVMAPALAARQAESIKAVQAEWVAHARADREFGGDRLDVSLGVARRALDAFGSPGLRALLEESGLGNHPELIRVFYRAGRAISEDSLVRGGGGGASLTVSAAQRMYPGMNP